MVSGGVRLSCAGRLSDLPGPARADAEREQSDVRELEQDAAAVEGDYFHQAPAEAADQLATEAEATAAAFDAVRQDQWERPSRRSNGSLFTVRTFAIYFLHDVEHHLHDVAR